MSPSNGETRWAIKPELLVSPSTGAEITMGIAYGPVLDAETMVCPVAELAEVRAARDEKREAAETQVSVMREAASRLRPLARRAITEAGPSGDEARRDLHEAISWLARGCPPEDAQADRPRAPQRTAEFLLEILRDATELSARVDMNDSDCYEVRVGGSHVGFVQLDDGGAIVGWV